ncbi:MAG TPA: hypothetical protein VIN10_02610 [Bacteroidales bacterium]
MSTIKQILSIAIIAVAIVSCNQNEVSTPKDQIDGGLKTNPLCGCTDFLLNDAAGNSLGTLNVYNEQAGPYFRFFSETGITAVYVWMGTDLSQMPNDYLNFPFTRTQSAKRVQISFGFNAINGACGNDYYFSAYAVLQDGTVISASDIYSSICCTDPYCETYQTETAFGGNSVGAGNAWWYYYKVADGGPQTIYAGQSIEIGTVNFSNGQIIINFTGGWELTDDSESVKIQGYTTLPSRRPPAGRFTTYKGTSLVVSVPSFPYYIIHLDVQGCTDPEYPELCLP